jgi:lia operon protein LiaG
MSNEKMKILELIEKKAISVEEGIRLLDVLEVKEKVEDTSEKMDDYFSDFDEENITEDHVDELKKSFKENIEGFISDLEQVYEKEIKSKNLNEDILQMFEEKINLIKDHAEEVKDRVAYAEDIEEPFDSEAFKKQIKEMAASMKKELWKVGNETDKFADYMNKIGSKTASVSQSLVMDVLSQIKGAIKSSDINLVFDGNESQEPLEPGVPQGFDLASTNIIDVKMIASDVHVITEDRDDIEVVCYGKSDDRNSFEVFHDREENRLIISEKKKSGFQIFISNRKIELKLPNKFKKNLRIKTVSGDLFINYLDVESLEFISVSGDLKADMVYSKNAMIKTTSGDARIKLFKGHMMFNSVSGDLDLCYEVLSGDLIMKTVSGDGKIKLPQESEFRIEMKTLSGDLRCDFPVTYIGQQRRGRIQGQVASDANLISATTTSGDLKLLKI